MSSACRSLALAALVAFAACEREERDTRGGPPGAESADQVVLSGLAPGAPPAVAVSSKGRAYERNAYHVSNGKRLFEWFNCVGCHGHGGGGSGPALMDDKWIYGGAIDNIVATIREGRPNGMPSFRGRIPDDQIWEIAAYVRSMQRAVPKGAAPGRDDDLMGAPAESRRPPAEPAPVGEPR
ncbi:MAG: c-type cytochrome [Rhodospirillaceae bacterium]|nr:c-type cytochrome [Rhodospirillaceae bacterium]